MQSNFEMMDLPLEGAKLITPFYVEDNRGYFKKGIERDVFSAWGLNVDIYEEFESYSTKGVIRGMHFQTKNPQIKIVSVLYGEVHDVIIDLRKDSKTFGEHIDVTLSEKNHKLLWVPKGFAHGFEVLSEEAIMSYKCIGKYLNGYDTGIRWNDEELNVLWETKNPILSERDRALMTYAEFKKNYGGL